MEQEPIMEIVEASCQVCYYHGEALGERFYDRDGMGHNFESLCPECDGVLENA